MWCSRCERNVPATASCDDEHTLRCSQCDGILATVAESASPPPTSSSDFADQLKVIPLDWDEWEWEDDIPGAVSRTGSGATPAALPHLDVPQPTLVRLFPGAAIRDDSPPVTPTRGAAQFFSWTVLALSLMAFACGAALVGWSFYTGRADLWRMGLPLVLLGQTGWLIGMVLQLDSLWQYNRATSQTLHDLDRRLQELRQAAELLNASRNSASQSFYAHLAEGASPQLLLADLKGQLDLLAAQLERRRAG